MTVFCKCKAPPHSCNNVKALGHKKAKACTTKVSVKYRETLRLDAPVVDKAFIFETVAPRAIQPLRAILVGNCISFSNLGVFGFFQKDSKVTVTLKNFYPYKENREGNAASAECMLFRL